MRIPNGKCGIRCAFERCPSLGSPGVRLVRPTVCQPIGSASTRCAGIQQSACLLAGKGFMAEVSARSERLAESVVALRRAGNNAPATPWCTSPAPMQGGYAKAAAEAVEGGVNAVKETAKIAVMPSVFAATQGGQHQLARRCRPSTQSPIRFDGISCFSSKGSYSGQRANTKDTSRTVL